MSIPFEEILLASSDAELRTLLTKAANDLDFATFSITLALEDESKQFSFESIHNTPEGYVDTFNDHSAAAIDPVMHHLRDHSTPLIWGQDIYTNFGSGEVYETQSAFGLAHGIALGLHLPDRVHIAFGLDRPTSLSKRPNVLIDVLSRVQLLSVYATEALLKLRQDVILDHTARYHEVIPHLSPRQLEVLRWASEGKTSWEIGTILSISEYTVNQHLAAIRASLKVVSRTQAVAKAVRLRLLK